ncbi:antibiotic biosynthesis monooxygenase [Gordonia sp. NB41Y]|uniref:antibiotic biosynthesis monooxygenase n=1 Tax=Gordonia sp. NB41Y TaxID=875808 RepID=UPI0003469D65|nr:antibiotic biosynthesis monooxygenase [Gordonia sp. NB41Y]EMP14371.2 hypothetical protein ISGA_2095 [Gordonia sp. NB41Y]WLP91849.1 antibiotic biosynthesis monooxygenase [Gordonia sp. NB41Y]
MTHELLHRIDKFSVPAEARDEFLDQINAIHRLLGRQPGILRNEVAQLVQGDSTFDVVTMVAWESRAAAEAAGRAIADDAAARGFDRIAFMQRLGVTGDFGTYVIA